MTLCVHKLCFQKKIALWSLTTSMLLSGCVSVANQANRLSCVSSDSPVINAEHILTLQGGLPHSDPFAATPAPITMQRVNLTQPVQVAVEGNDIFVADQAVGKVYRIDEAMQTLNPFIDMPGRNPGGLYVDRVQDMYLVEPMRRRVLRFDRSGRALTEFSDSLALPSPVDVVAPEQFGYVYVADAARATVVMFNRLGDVMRIIGDHGAAPNPMRSVTALAAGPDGIYVLDKLAQSIHVFTPQGQYRNRLQHPALQFPVALAVDEFRRVFVADQFDNSIKVFGAAQQYQTLQFSHGFQRISDVWLTAIDRLYVADAGSASVEVFILPPPCT